MLDKKLKKVLTFFCLLWCCIDGRLVESGSSDLVETPTTKSREEDIIRKNPDVFTPENLELIKEKQLSLEEIEKILEARKTNVLLEDYDKIYPMVGSVMKIFNRIRGFFDLLLFGPIVFLIDLVKSKDEFKELKEFSFDLEYKFTSRAEIGILPYMFFKTLYAFGLIAKDSYSLDFYRNRPETISIAPGLDVVGKILHDKLIEAINKKPDDEHSDEVKPE